MNPVIIFSDHPAGQSGLARITRDLATRMHNAGMKVATLGAGSSGSIKLPFPQYNWRENDFFIPHELAIISNDFAGLDAPFTLLSIGDIQRFLPLADTQFCQERVFAGWWKMVREQKRAKLWGYFPVDAHGVGGKLPPQLGHTLTHYDRILVPSNWAKEIVLKTLPDIKIDAIPHGIDTDVFKPYPKQESRARIGELLDPLIQWPKTFMDVSDEALWIGIVATNQQRKDWGLGMEVVAELKKTRPVFLWAHTDKLKRDSGWSILELVGDFGLAQSAMVTTGNISDEVMAICYSAMDLTLGIGRGEGFGYPIAESLACGVQCFASSYGAQLDYVYPADLLDPYRTRTEGVLNLQRPVHHVKAWANAITSRIEDPRPGVNLPDCLKWENVWPRFESWLKEESCGSPSPIPQEAELPASS